MWSKVGQEKPIPGSNENVRGFEITVRYLPVPSISQRSEELEGKPLLLYGC